MKEVGKMETTYQTRTAQQSERVQTHTDAILHLRTSAQFGSRHLTECTGTSCFRSKILRNYWIFVIRLFKQGE